MKKLIRSIPIWLQVTIYFLLLASATFVAGTIPVLNDFLFFTVLAFLTALLFIKAGNGSIRSIGVYPLNRHHWVQFFTGSAVGGGMLLATLAATVFLTGDTVSFNRFDPVYLAVTMISVLWSAYAQEFVFRGFPFHALLSKYRGWKVQLIIMIPFGLMHVNAQMDASTIAIVMLTTGLGSLLFGLAYIKTRNLSLPVGLHFGWNYLQELLPRTADNNTRGLITIHTTHISYNRLMVIFPYLLIILAAIFLLWAWKPGRPALRVTAWHRMKTIMRPLTVVLIIVSVLYLSHTSFGRRLVTRHFVINSASSTDRGKIYSIADSLENNYSRVCADLGARPPYPVVVNVYPTRWQYIMATGHAFSSGNIEGKGLIHMLPRGNDEAGPGIVALHEFTHLLVLNRLLDINAEYRPGEFERKFTAFPVWLFEAVSLYEARQYPASFHELTYIIGNTGLAELSNRLQGGKIYKVGYTISQYIIHRYGKDKLLALIDSFGNLTELGVSEKEFTESWADFVHKYYFKYPGDSAVVRESLPQSGSPFSQVQ